MPSKLYLKIKRSFFLPKPKTNKGNKLLQAHLYSIEYFKFIDFQNFL